MKTENIVIAVLCFALLGLGLLYFNERDNSGKHELEIAKAVERIVGLQKESQRNVAIIDSLKGRSQRLDSIIAVQNNNEKRINEKYNAKRNKLHSLPADSALKFFSAHIR